MRNLKRVLSLALAAIMLIGMMAFGTSAVDVSDFYDAEQIDEVYKEAATVTAGLDLIAGEEGNFNPKKDVTRAMMAAIVVKLLYGSNYNANGLKGIEMFSDTASFEGGWAEGYINQCAQLGIVSGYGDGTFRPGKTVTTAEASLMLMKALGYFDPKNPANEYAGGWELAAMSKAGYLGLNGDVTMMATQPLHRDDVALLVFNTLKAQLVSYQESLKDYAKSNNHQVTVNNGTVDSTNTLLYNTFHVYIAEGVVMANGYTNKNFAASSTSDALTCVRFTEETDLDQDRRYEYAVGDEYTFVYNTDLDLIGHAVDVYYTLDRRTPEVVLMLDQATKVGYITYDANNTNLSDAATAAGFRRNSILDWGEDNWFVNYDLYTTVSDYVADKETWSDGSAVALTTVGRNTKVLSAGTKPVDKHVLLISNSGNLTVDCVIVLDQYLDTVAEIDNTKNDLRYYLSTKTGGADLNVPTYAKVAEEDYVIVTPIGLDTKIAAFEKAEIINSNITRITGITNTNSDVKRVIAGGVTYFGSPVWSNDELTNIEAFVDISTIGEATLALDRFGDLIALIEEVYVPSYAYVAQYGVWHSTTGIRTTEQLTAHVFWADGINGVYLVDDFCNNAANTGSILGATTVPTNIETKIDDLFTSRSSVGPNSEPVQHSINDGNWNAAGTTTTVNGRTVFTPTAFNNTGAPSLTCAGLLGVWEVTLLANGHISIAPAQTTLDSNVTSMATKADAGPAYYQNDNNRARLATGHATFVDIVNNTPIRKITGSATYTERNVLYQNHETVYFYPNQYSRSAYDEKLIEVEVLTGINNAHTHTNSGWVDTKKADGTAAADNVQDPGKPQITQVWTNEGARTTVGAVLVEGYAVTATKTTYYYNTGNYSVVKNADGVTYDLIYTVFTTKGEEVELVYGGFRTSAAAKATADTKWDGFYQNGDTDLAPLTGRVSDANNTYVVYNNSGDNTTYVVNDNAKYWTYIGTNTFTAALDIGFINSDTTVVDTRQDVLFGKTEAIDSIAKMQRAVNGKDGGNLLVAYIYDSKNYKGSTLYISEYDPDVYVEIPVGDPDININVFVDIDWYGETHDDGGTPPKPVPTVTIRHAGPSSVAADVNAVRQAIADLWNLNASQVTPVRSVADGKVVWSGTLPDGGRYELVEEYISINVTSGNREAMQSSLASWNAVSSADQQRKKELEDLLKTNYVTFDLPTEVVYDPAAAAGAGANVVLITGRVNTFAGTASVPGYGKEYNQTFAQNLTAGGVSNWYLAGTSTTKTPVKYGIVGWVNELGLPGFCVVAFDADNNLLMYNSGSDRVWSSTDVTTAVKIAVTPAN